MNYNIKYEDILNVIDKEENTHIKESIKVLNSAINLYKQI